MARTMSHYYPIHLDIQGQRCVVVGGGQVAARKAASLLDCGANVLLISPGLSPRLRRRKRLRVAQRHYRADDVRGAALVIAATDDPEVNRKVSEDARRSGALVNVVDRPELCSFLVPACVRRGGLTISVSTDGASPALAKRIRQEIEKRYGPEYARLAEAVRRLRGEVIRTIPDAGRRRRVFEKMASAAMARLLRERGAGALQAALQRLVKQR